MPRGRPRKYQTEEERKQAIRESNRLAARKFYSENREQVLVKASQKCKYEKPGRPRRSESAKAMTPFEVMAFAELPMGFCRSDPEKFYSTRWAPLESSTDK